MNKKTILLVVGILIVVMGVLALIPGLNMGTEPVWHAVAKIVLGAVSIYFAVAKESAAGTVLLIDGIVLAVMGLLGIFLKLPTFSAPVWHSAAVVVVGGVVAWLGSR